MAIMVNNVYSGITEDEENAKAQALSRLGLRGGDVASCEVRKVSLDARRRERVRFVRSVVIRLDSSAMERRLASAFSPDQVRYVEEQPFVFPQAKGDRGDIVIAGLGPAGLMAGLVLAEHGYRPIILERGRPMDERSRDVEMFWKTGKLLPESNVQFGEGGAGAFSDGKLTTRIGDSRCRYVLERLVDNGAPPDILQKAKPHIGTDKLREVVVSIRRHIERQGGKVCWQTPILGFRQNQGQLTAVRIPQGELPASALILAVGHSARDTFAMLLEEGVEVRAKPFSVGLRIEHPQRVIDRGLYGDLAGHPQLPIGEYQLSLRQGGRGVYTFCMCPGGVVVPAASEADGVVTNGMSYHARAGKNANAALVVEVTPKDYGSGALDGVAFQRHLERLAYTTAGGTYRAPGSTVGAFLGRPVTGERVTPSYSLGTVERDLRALFPAHITALLQEGLLQFGRRLPGFAMTGAYLTGVESRTSSPVQMLRDRNGQSLSVAGLYPCGEGAGAAGGIMSAAVDGLRCALAAANQVNG